ARPRAGQRRRAGARRRRDRLREADGAGGVPPPGDVESRVVVFARPTGGDRVAGGGKGRGKTTARARCRRASSRGGAAAGRLHRGRARGRGPARAGPEGRGPERTGGASPGPPAAGYSAPRHYRSVDMGLRASRLFSWMMRAAWSWARRSAEIRHGSRAARRFAGYGPGTSIAFPTATVFGEPWIELGSHTLIGADITLAAGMLPGLDLGPR